MIPVLAKLLSNTRLRRKRFLDAILKRVSPAFRNLGFFLQGQMDIGPMSYWYNRPLSERTGGFFPSNDSVRRTIADVEAWDQVRRDMIVLLLRSVVERKITGDLAELGVWRGYTARLIHHYLPEREVHLFDTFSGFDKRDLSGEFERTGHMIDNRDFSDTSVAGVLKHVAPLNNNVQCHQGFFPNSIPPALHTRQFAFVHLDADLYDPVRAGLEFFYDRTSPGGFILVHDYNAWVGARAAVDDFFLGKSEVVVPMPDKSGSALIVKS